MKKLIFLIIVLMSSTYVNAQFSGNQAIDKQVEALVTKLTLEEKAALCSGRDDWSTKPNNRLQIPWIWMADGPHGLRRAPATNKPGYGDQLPATCFPTASAMAATWDTRLIFEVGQALAVECQAMDVNILLGPGVNIKRSVLGGRNFEYYSEDPILSGEMGAAFIQGVQSLGVGTSLKHFATNNTETNRMYVNSNLDQRTLHEIYLTPFEIAVKKAKPTTIMACYNRVQGTYGTQSNDLLHDVLKNKWDYQGVVISDWFAVVDRVEALKAGMHIEMPGVSTVNDSLIVQAVKNGALDEQLLNDRVKDILRLVLYTSNPKGAETANWMEDHHAFARQVASQAATLLRNEQEVLPLEPAKYKKIAIIGEFAANPRYQGNGSSEVKPTKVDNILDIIQKEYSHNFEVSYAPGYDLANDNDLSLINDALKVAAQADIALVFAGLPLHYESEGIDRKHINLPQSHNELIQNIAGVQKNTVVVLTNGSAVAMPWINQVAAVLETWLGGQAGAGATADVLFGKVNPSGKLPETFPVKLEDTPAFLNFPGENGEVLYGERIYVGYRYYDMKNTTPLFCFGHGLSYTTFEYLSMEVSRKNFTDADTITVNIKIKNTGRVAGKEVVQLYVTDVESTVARPKQELKRFAKIEIQPGEVQEVTFRLHSRDFAFYDSRRSLWMAERGEYKLLAGASSRDIRLTETVLLDDSQPVALAFDEYTFFKDYWKNLQTREILKTMVPKWVSGFVPEGKTLDEASIPDFFTEQPIIKFPYITSGEITHEQVMQLVDRCKSLTFKP